MSKMKRMVSLLLVGALLLSGVVFTAPEASAYAAAKPLPALTGNKAQDVANIAISQLGYKEVKGGTLYGAWWSGVTGWGDYTYLGWCAMFANWCAYQAGAGMNVGYNKYCAIVGNSYSFLKENGYADRSFNTTPQPGDFIYFGRGNSFEHVAIVVGYDRTTNEVTFVGGNQGNAVTQATIKWSSSTKWGSQYILGYARPNYGDAPVVQECSCDTGFAGYYTCATSSNPLNIRSGHSTNSAILGGIPKGATVYVSKAQGGNGGWAHVEYNGISGYASMQYLRPAGDYVVDVAKDSGGKVSGVEITVFDYVKSAGQALTLSEKIPAASSVSQAVPIRVSVPDAYQLDLTVTAENPGNGNVFVAEYPDGTTELLKETVVNGAEVSVSMREDVTLYLLKKDKAFPDIPESFWAKKEIDYMTAREYMLGKTDGTFGAGEIISRRTVALMLYRLAGEPEVSGECPFPDVKPGLYYNAITWANQCGIVTGYKDGTFRPDSSIARQHFALMLHRYAMYQGTLLPAVTDSTLSDFSDCDLITDASKEACQWALTCGIINGRTGGIYDPQGGTSRAQMAVILCRFLQACNQSQNLD